MPRRSRRWCSSRASISTGSAGWSRRRASGGRGATLGLLVPELPVVFVWGGRTEGMLFERALEKADRVIIDSVTRPLPALLAIAERVARGAPVGDLAWARIFPWMSMAAEVLDLP